MKLMGLLFFGAWLVLSFGDHHEEVESNRQPGIIFRWNKIGLDHSKFTFVLSKIICRLYSGTKKKKCFASDEHTQKSDTGSLNCQTVFINQGRVSVEVKGVVIRAAIWGSILSPVKSDTVSPTVCHRCDVSLEQRCPVAKPRR